MGRWAKEFKQIFAPNRKLKDRLRDTINFLDTPIDNIKHKIHGMKVCGKVVYLPKWLMRNKDGQDQPKMVQNGIQEEMDASIQDWTCPECKTVHEKDIVPRGRITGFGLFCCTQCAYQVYKEC